MSKDEELPKTSCVKYFNDRLWGVVAIFIVGILSTTYIVKTELSDVKVEMAKIAGVVDLIKDGKLKITEVKDSKDETFIDKRKMRKYYGKLLSMTE